MIKTISKLITNYFVKHNIIKNEIEIYEYGFELMVSTWIGTIIVFIIGMCTNHLLDAIIYECVFRITRIYTGGYHCKTYLRCILTYVLFFIIFLLVIHYLNYFTLLGIIVISIINLLITKLFCPVDNKNKRLSSEEKVLFKKKCFKRVLFVNSVSVILFLLKSNQTVILCYSMIIIDLLVIIGYIENKLK